MTILPAGGVSRHEVHEALTRSVLEQVGTMRACIGLSLLVRVDDHGYENCRGMQHVRGVVFHQSIKQASQPDCALICTSVIPQERFSFFHGLNDRHGRI